MMFTIVQFMFSDGQREYYEVTPYAWSPVSAGIEQAQRLYAELTK